MKRLVAIVAVAGALVPLPAMGQTEPRQIAFVATIESDRPLFDGDGSPSEAASNQVDTRNARIEAVLDEPPSTPFALKVSGVFCDELRALGTPEADRLLDNIRRLADGREVLTVNYTEARLHDIAGDALVDDIRDGQQAVQRCTDVEPIDVLWAAAGAPPDEEALEALVAEWPHTVLTHYASPLPPDSSTLTFMPLVEFGAPTTPDELATRRPGAPEVIAATELTPAITQVDEIADDDGFDVVRAAALRQGWNQGPLYETPERSGAYERAIGNGALASSVFDALTDGTDNPLSDVHRTVLARATGSVYESEEESRQRAEALARSVQRVTERITVADGSVTFTSRSGSVPVTITNRNDFPVRVEIRLMSPKLSFPEDDRQTVLVEPPGDTITFAAIARSSGTFPTIVRATVPRHRVQIDEPAEIDVRSTAANLSAVVLTAGGALFLAYWLIRRVRRVGWGIRPKGTP